MWKVLQLSQELKESADLTKVIRLAADLALPEDEAAALQAKLASGAISTPSPQIITRAKQNLDVVAMLYMAKIYEEFDVWAFDMIDSSPQRGWNFLVVRTDEFVFPKAMPDRARLAVDLATVYQRRTAPITCLGYGKAGLAEKLSNYAHAGCLETQNINRWGSSIIKQELLNNPIRQAWPIG